MHDDDGAVTDILFTLNVDVDNAHVVLLVLSRISNLYVPVIVGVHEYGDVDIAFELIIVHDVYDEHDVTRVEQ
jgi:hypothetical protein